MTTEDVWAVLESGVLGEGAYMTVSAVVDNTAPVVTDISKSLINDKLTITAQDDNYIAAVRITNQKGTQVFATVLPEQTEKNQEVSTVIDLTGIQTGKKYVVTVADYAGNMTSYLVTSTAEDVDYTGQMFAWTRNGNRRTEEEIAQGVTHRWMKVDPDTLWFDNDSKNYSGTSTYQATSYQDIYKVDGYGSVVGYYLIAAEYVEGFVIFALQDGYLYSVPLDDLNDTLRLGCWMDAVAEQNPGVTASYMNLTINNMSLNYQDG